MNKLHWQGCIWFNAAKLFVLLWQCHETVDPMSLLGLASSWGKGAAYCQIFIARACKVTLWECNIALITYQHQVLPDSPLDRVSSEILEQDAHYPCVSHGLMKRRGPLIDSSERLQIPKNLQAAVLKPAGIVKASYLKLAPSCMQGETLLFPTQSEIQACLGAYVPGCTRLMLCSDLSCCCTGGRHCVWYQGGAFAHAAA